MARSTADGALVVTAEADELLRPGEARSASARERDRQPPVLDRVGGDIGVAARGERRGFVQDFAGALDDALAARLVVAAAARRAAVLGDGVGAVEGVVEAAPTGIGGVESVARVRHRHDELRAGDRGDLRVDVLGAHANLARLGQKIADVAQEALVFGGVEGPSLALAMIPVDTVLQGVAGVEQGAVLGREVAHKPGETGPEGVRRQAGAGQRLLVDEALEGGCDLEAAAVDALRHSGLPNWIMAHAGLVRPGS